MHKGVYVGSNAIVQRVRVLILGESHHINKEDVYNCDVGKEATYPTFRVVEEYFADVERKEKSLRFFERIAESFCDYASLEEEKTTFWNKVCFGNYIPVLCGVGDNTATKIIKKDENRKIYNNDLFNFVNSNEIDVIFCFSRRVYNALPSVHNKMEDQGKVLTGIYVGGKADYISCCEYMPNVDHKNTDVLLKKKLRVYCMRHPSGKGGFIPSNYKGFLQECFHKYIG